MKVIGTETLTETTERTEASTSRDSDEAFLAALGYKQELRRNFSPLQIFGIAFSIAGLVSSFSSVLIFSIPYGGPVSMIWGWSFSSIFLAMIALALGELASSAPTSGGLYYWTFAFSSEKYRCFLSWIVGYANTISNVASVASIEWGCAVQIMAAVNIGSAGFKPTNAQIFGVYSCLIVVHGLINTQNPKVIAQIQIPFIILNVLLCCVVIIILPAVTPKEARNTARFAFGNFTNLTEWDNVFAFILSFLTPSWTAGYFDAAVHLSEEAKNARVAIPYAIILSILSTLILGWAINVALVFSMGQDIGAVIDSPVGQPMAAILLRSCGEKGALAIWALVIAVQFAIGTSQLTACSRQIFAFCRDGALPFSKWVYHVDPRTHTPVRSVWFSAGLSVALGTLSFAGTNAINAIFSLVITGQYTAYAIPIAARWIGGQTFQPGPITFGSWSLPITVLAITWMVFMSVIVMFPANKFPGVNGMNYTVVVQVGVLLLATMYYFFPKYGGRYWFKGPVNTLAEPFEPQEKEVEEKDVVGQEADSTLTSGI